MRGVITAAVVLCAVVVGACQFPRDPEETLDRVEDGTMYVGVIDDPPWAILHEDRDPTGLEPDLIREFADELDAEIVWIEEPEADMVEAMRGFQLDVIIGGLTRDSRYRNDVALTRPYMDTEIEFGVPPGQELPDDLDEVEIQVERNSEAAALLQQEEGEANPVYVNDVEDINAPALLHDYEIDELGFERTDRIQRDDEHAMAVPMGENAFLVKLEQFLLDRGQEAEEMLKAQVTG